MEADIDGLMDSIADSVWSRVPTYSTTLVGPQDLRARVEESITTVIACLREDRNPSADELASSQRNGERRALQGVSHAAVVQSYRQAERLLGDMFQSLCMRMQVRSASARAGRTQMIANLDMLERAMVDAFTRMREQITVNNAIAEPTLIRRLALGDSVTTDEVAQLATTMGMDNINESPFVGAALAFTDPEDATDLARARHHLVVRLNARVQTTVLSGTVTTRGREIAVFAIPWGADVAQLGAYIDEAIGIDDLRVATRVAVGDVQRGLVHVGVSCRQAIATLRVCEEQGLTRRATLYRESLLEVAARHDEDIARSLHERYLLPLESQPFLLETLRVHLETDLSVVQTAERLHVHKNTVAYRLRRIHDLTGLSLQASKDVARAVLALESTPSIASDTVIASQPERRSR